MKLPRENTRFASERNRTSIIIHFGHTISAPWLLFGREATTIEPTNKNRVMFGSESLSKVRLSLLICSRSFSDRHTAQGWPLFRDIHGMITFRALLLIISAVSLTSIEIRENGIELDGFPSSTISAGDAKQLAKAILAARSKDASEGHANANEEEMNSRQASPSSTQSNRRSLGATCNVAVTTEVRPGWIKDGKPGVRASSNCLIGNIHTKK